MNKKVLIITIIILATGVVVGYFYYSTTKNITASQPEKSLEYNSDTNVWATYNNSESTFNFLHPINFVVSDNRNHLSDISIDASRVALVDSISNTVIGVGVQYIPLNYFDKWLDQYINGSLRNLPNISTTTISSFNVIRSQQEYSDLLEGKEIRKINIRYQIYKRLSNNYAWITISTSIIDGADLADVDSLIKKIITTISF